MGGDWSPEAPLPPVTAITPPTITTSMPAASGSVGATPQTAQLMSAVNTITA